MRISKVLTTSFYRSKKSSENYLHNLLKIYTLRLCDLFNSGGVGMVIGWSCLASYGPGRIAVMDENGSSAFCQNIQKKNVRPT